MTRAAPISVLVPTHNRNELLLRTLESLMACDVPDHREIRVFVIENGGEYGAREICARALGALAKVDYRFVSAGNKSAALNSVLSEIPDHLLVFLDDDVRVDRQLLVEYATVAGEEREGRFFGGGVLPDYEEVPAGWLRKYLPRSVTGWHPAPESYAPLDGSYFLGANWAAFSRDLMKVGGFDSRFGPGAKSGATGQETQMQRTLARAGVAPVYVPGALVWHYVPKVRSSPDWAIERAFRNGVASGYDYANRYTGRAFFGVPFWMWRFSAVLSLERLRLTLSMADEPSRFSAKFKAASLWGSIVGCFRHYRRKRRA